MHGRIGLSVAIGIATALFAGQAGAQAVEIVDHHALRVCADPSAPPFSSEDGSGFENRIAALFAQDLGVPVRYTWFPNTMGFYRRTLNARQCDLVIGAPAEMDMAQPTMPYYRSTFALVWRSTDGWSPRGLDDPGLKTRRIGAQARTPPGTVLVRHGLADNLHAYDLMVDSRVSSVGGQMITDLLAHRIDVAVLWGPVAGYQVALHPGELSLLPLGDSQDGEPMAFDIAMAVRKGEPVWRARVDRFITTHRPDIARILASAHVPLASPVEAAP